MTTRFGFVSTYPPTICGLATFTSSLFNELVTVAGNEGRVIRLVETPQPQTGPEVVGHLVAGDPRSAYERSRVAQRRRHRHRAT